MKPRVYQCQRCANPHWILAVPNLRGGRRAYDHPTWADAIHHANALARKSGVQL